MGWDLIPAILGFLYQDLHVPYIIFLVMGQNRKYNILYWYVHNTYKETSKEQKTMSDK